MDPIEAARQRTLILQCQLGSRSALKELYLSHNQPLTYYLRRMLNCEDTEDVEQEVWLTVIRRIGRLRTPEAFVVWLYRIARSKAINRLADRRALLSFDEQDLVIPTDEPEPEFTPDDAARVHLLVMMIAARRTATMSQIQASLLAISAELKLIPRQTTPSTGP
jgi:RNA polymerase sigma factor (sigma-70 family)